MGHGTAGLDLAFTEKGGVEGVKTAVQQYRGGAVWQYRGGYRIGGTCPTAPRTAPPSMVQWGEGCSGGHTTKPRTGTPTVLQTPPAPSARCVVRSVCYT